MWYNILLRISDTYALLFWINSIVNVMVMISIDSKLYMGKNNAQQDIK